MKNKKGFTLVELIVVITILSILGTIAFLSMQGYSADVRNSKRISDLNNIVTKIDLGIALGQDLFSFVDGTGSMLNWSKVQIAGFTGITLSGYYLAGDINFTALGIKDENFKDPKNNVSYKIGATIKKRGKYELAATIEEGGGNVNSLIVGNWVKRFASASSINPARGNRAKPSVGNEYYLTGIVEETGLILGDSVEIGGTGSAYVIKNMKGQTLYLDSNITTDGFTIYINSDEMLHLIASKNSKNATIKVGEGEKYVPYKLD